MVPRRTRAGTPVYFFAFIAFFMPFFGAASSACAAFFMDLLFIAFIAAFFIAAMIDEVSRESFRIR